MNCQNVGQYSAHFIASPSTAAASCKKRASVGNLRFRVHARLRKSRKAPVSFVMYVRPSVRPSVRMYQLSHL